MVDLVKLRKKAKGARATASAPAEETPSLEPGLVPEAGGSLPVVSTRESETLQPVPLPKSTVFAATDVPASAAESKLVHFRAEAGRTRDGFIAEEKETSDADQVELLTFVLAGEQYAVSIEHLVEIVTPRTATPVPNADRAIVGIISLRGTIVTVIDVRQKLGHQPGAGSNDTRTIVAERNGETLGFEVDRVLRVLKVGTAAIEPHPVVHPSEQTEAIRGVFRQANALTILLDLDKLLA
jgi:purine-binding chemotaxis protein CheW